MEQFEFKDDITAVYANVSRGPAGLSVNVRASRKIEDFFKNASGEVTEPADLRLHGRHWLMKEKDFRVYAIGDPILNGVIPLVTVPGIIGYRLDKPGARMIDLDRDGRGNVINLSFIKKVGISSPEGFQVVVKGVYSEAQVRQIYDGIIAAAVSFTENFLKIIDLSVIIREN